jgi:hypothetical protein
VTIIIFCSLLAALALTSEAAWPSSHLPVEASLLTPPPVALCPCSVADQVVPAPTTPTSTKPSTDSGTQPSTTSPPKVDLPAVTVEPVRKAVTANTEVGASLMSLIHPLLRAEGLP